MGQRGSQHLQMYCPHGGRVGQKGLSIHRDDVYCPHGWDREGVYICGAEVHCPHGGRVGQRGVSIYRGEVYCPHGGRVGQRRGQHLQS